MEDRDSGQGAGAQHQRPVGQYQSTLSAARVRGCNGGSSRDKTVIWTCNYQELCKFDENPQTQEVLWAPTRKNIKTPLGTS